jgi:hypothetical protein
LDLLKDGDQDALALAVLVEDLLDDFWIDGLLAFPLLLSTNRLNS